MKALVVYVLGRFLVFGVLLLALWAIGLELFLAAGVALVASIPIAYVVLRAQRDKATAALQARAQRKAELRARFRGP
ncbi:MAG: DUF4229 domain-containing protein [Geodermatophilaceae bacterium]|nr:DUF4229 domain-containing protein [Geodermatophilaceae bacterium]MDQ3456640.1 DUF4229 domain-containing protein [Actinomycetota bacterium]